MAELAVNSCLHEQECPVLSSWKITSTVHWSNVIVQLSHIQWKLWATND